MKKRPLLKNILRDYAINLNKEIVMLQRPEWKDERVTRISALKDATYFLGLACGEEYDYGDGFERFCKEIGVEWSPAGPRGASNHDA